MIKYPDIEVVLDLNGPDGNAFFILAKVRDELRKAGASKEERQQFLSEAQSGNYQNLLEVCQNWVSFQAL